MSLLFIESRMDALVSIGKLFDFFLLFIYLSNVIRMILKGVISSGESYSPQHCDK